MDITSKAGIGGVKTDLTGCIANVAGIECAIPYALANVDGIEVVVPFGEAYETIDVVPYQTGTLTYTGSALTPTWAGYDESTLIIGGTTSATNAGTYTATFTPADGYVWADTMEAEARSVNWAIGKAAGKVTLSKTSISLTQGSSTTFTVSRSGDGAISVSGTAMTLAVSLSGTTVTVTGMLTGSATVAVTVAEGTNHLAASATCSVTVTAAMRTVILTGTSWNSEKCYVEINGTKYYNATTLTVENGSTIACSYYSNYAGGVYVDGSVVHAQHESQTYTYNYTLDSDITINANKPAFNSWCLNITTS